jgi:pilus assembly protein Flp/PilA
MPGNARSGLSRLSDILSNARNETLTAETKHMQRKLRNCYSKFQTLMLREEGQDLIEYAMVVALIAFAATAGIQAAASGVNTVFTTIATTLRNATS